LAKFVLVEACGDHFQKGIGLGHDYFLPVKGAGRLEKTDARGGQPMGSIVPSRGGSALKLAGKRRPGRARLTAGSVGPLRLAEGRPGGGVPLFAAYRNIIAGWGKGGATIFRGDNKEQAVNSFTMPRRLVEEHFQNGIMDRVLPSSVHEEG